MSAYAPKARDADLVNTTTEYRFLGGWCWAIVPVEKIEVVTKDLDS